MAQEEDAPAAVNDTASTSSYTFDPKDPVPTIGGGISAADSVMRSGAFDQRGRPDFMGCKDTLPLNFRSDVMTFQTPLLESEVEVTGPIEMIRSSQAGTV